MKKTVLMLLFAIGVFAFAGKAQTTQPGWPEMKAFHSLMSGTFHPAEEGNLAPLRAKADSLLAGAEAWQKSEIPANYKPVETKEALTKLVNRCRDIKKAVLANMNDDKLKKMIADAHDIFHKIVGECQKADK